MNDYDVYAEYCKCKKIHGLRLRSIMRVFNYAYRNNKSIREQSLRNWDDRLIVVCIDVASGPDVTVTQEISIKAVNKGEKDNEFEKH